MEKKVLPTSYKAIGYIVNPSKAYIDTGVKSKGGNKIIITARFTQNNDKDRWDQNNYIIGSSEYCYRVMTDGSYRTEIISNNGKLTALKNGKGYWSSIPIDLEKHTYTLDTVGKNLIFGMDGKILYDKQTDYVQAGNVSIHIFESDFLYHFFTNIEIYGLKIWDMNYNLIRDMQPCLNAEGVYGMWDYANGKFYGSSNSVGLSGGVCRVINLLTLCEERRAA